MKQMKNLTLIVALIGSAVVGSASAKAATVTPSVASDAKQAKSRECSALADKQALHGKARKAFRSKCKSGQS